MSSSSEHPPDARPLTGRPLVVVLALATVLGYAFSQATLDLALTLARHGLDIDGTGFVVLNLVGLAATGTCVAVSVITRLPGAATAVALVVWVLDGGIRLFGPRVFDTGYQLYPVLAALCLLGADVVLLARRQRRATLPWVALAGVVVAVLLLVLREAYFRLTVADYAQFYRLSAQPYLRDGASMVAVFVLGGVLGWAVGRRLRSRAAERVAVG